MPAERSVLKKSPCKWKKNKSKSEGKKLTIFEKTGPTELSFDTIHVYKKIHLVYTFGDFLCKNEQFLNLFVSRSAFSSVKSLSKLTPIRAILSYG